jgi:hypothetical protein
MGIGGEPVNRCGTGGFIGIFRHSAQEVREKMRPQAGDPNEDQIDGDGDIKNARHQKDQNSRYERDKRLYQHQVDPHRARSSSCSAG